MRRERLQELLLDVRHRGSVCIEKRKLLWMLGRSNESATAWAMLLDEWQEVGGVRDSLSGKEWGGWITLVIGKGDGIQNVQDDWAGGP
jgi:hypothetical protein